MALSIIFNKLQKHLNLRCFFFFQSYTFCNFIRISMLKQTRTVYGVEYDATDALIRDNRTTAIFSKSTIRVNR